MQSITFSLLVLIATLGLSAARPVQRLYWPVPKVHSMRNYRADDSESGSSEESPEVVDDVDSEEPEDDWVEDEDPPDFDKLFPVAEQAPHASNPFFFHMREQIQEHAWKKPTGGHPKRGQPQRGRGYMVRRPVYYRRYRGDDSESSEEEDSDEVFEDIVSEQYNTPDFEEDDLDMFDEPVDMFGGPPGVSSRMYRGGFMSRRPTFRSAYWQTPRYRSRSSFVPRSRPRYFPRYWRPRPARW